MAQQKNIWTVIFVIIVLVVVAGGIYWWQTTSKDQESFDTLEVSQNFETYSNTDLGYEIQYPLTWEISLDGDAQTVFANKDNPSEEIGIRISKKLYPDKDIWEWAEASNWPMTDNPRGYFEEITVDGITALKDPEINTVHVVKGNKYYMIENGIGMERNVVDSTLYYQIVETFKFIN